MTSRIHDDSVDVHYARQGRLKFSESTHARLQQYYYAIRERHNYFPLKESRHDDPFDKESSSLNAPSYGYIFFPSVPLRITVLPFLSFPFFHRNSVWKPELASAFLLLIKYWCSPLKKKKKKKKDTRYWTFPTMYSFVLFSNGTTHESYWSDSSNGPSHPSCISNTFQERRRFEARNESGKGGRSIRRQIFFRCTPRGGRGEKWGEGGKDRPRWPHGVMTRVWFLKCSRTPCNQEWRGSIRPSSPRRATLDIYNLNLARP